MIYKNDLIETSRSHLGLGVDIGRAALQPVYIPIEKLSETNLCDWVASALVGHCIQYHEGLLLRDRSETNSDLTTKDRARIHSVARRAWIACELGLVGLFSQKVGEDPENYVGIEIKVAESKYTAWPPGIRDLFEPARTLKTGKPSYKLEQIKSGVIPDAANDSHFGGGV